MKPQKLIEEFAAMRATTRVLDQYYDHVRLMEPVIEAAEKLNQVSKGRTEMTPEERALDEALETYYEKYLGLPKKKAAP